MPLRHFGFVLYGGTAIALPALFPGFPALEAIRALVYFGDGDLASLSYADRATLIAHADRVAAPVAMSIVSERLAGP